MLPFILCSSALALCLLLLALVATCDGARPMTYSELLDDASYSRWKRPFFNPYPSWVSFVKQMYNRRLGANGLGDDGHMRKRPFFNVFPSLYAAEGD